MDTNASRLVDDRTIEIAGHVFEINPLAPGFDREKLIERYWAAHPRFQFFKQVPPRARLLDVGAGAGGLAFWKSWGAPQRSDIEMYGVDQRIGQHAGMYVEFKQLNLDTEPLPFSDASFDVFFASHLIEHVDNVKLMGEAARVLKPGGHIYLETPTPQSKKAPARTEFVNAGFPCSTLNFYDDHTHIDTLDLPYLEAALSKLGFGKFNSGIIELAQLEPELISAGLALRDAELLTYGLWSRFHFAAYIAATKA